MKIRSLLLTAAMGIGTLTLVGCVEGGGYSGAYVTTYDAPYYGGGYNGGYYGGYRDGGYYRGYPGYRRDGGYHRRDYADRRRDNDRPRGPGRGDGRPDGPRRDYNRDRPDNNQIIVPNADSPRGPMFSRGGN
ncbi:hypothetical protein [Rhizobium tumorigenes]|uniref:Lipoprotein n=1 Tax=Rhizobium tumorigenes TaxID=2041385 RepID=A0AAF1K4H5_9HYPH|nr:hypothetical protein [Rhizobium tumorigenes]WFR95420.1 hypothetical protein PR017_16875 [Rhizobium tumorigenes]